MVFDEIGYVLYSNHETKSHNFFLFVHRGMYLVNVSLKYSHKFLLEKKIYVYICLHWTHMFMYILRYYTHHAASVQSGFNF